MVSARVCVQAVLAVSLCALPKEFTGIFTEDKDRVVKNWHLFFCVCTGLWGGLIIGLITEYYTSNAFQPVQVSCHAQHSCHAQQAEPMFDVDQIQLVQLHTKHSTLPVQFELLIWLPVYCAG